jgi:putative solute:sodium symporter small subunit
LKTLYITLKLTIYTVWGLSDTILSLKKYSKKKENSSDRILSSTQESRTDKNNKRQTMSDSNAQSYWKSNIKLVIKLMCVWFFISFGCGILFVDALDTIRFGGFKLGFWIAQQGSILVFVALIYIYIYYMDKLDDRYKKDSLESSDEAAEEAK